ncbi:MAG: DUF4124 domain-containing protein [Nitrospira sp.]|nr:DUF4124 domain-containing protein [Nitrospira sp.]
MKVFILGLMSGLLFWPVIGFADLYKWTDDQGNLHITDMPPPLTQRKSANTVAPVPRSASPKKATVRPTLPERPQAQIHPVPGSSSPSPPTEEVLIQQPMEGLSPNQATLTSSWQVFDGMQMNTKAPVQRWKDERGVEHFVDVLPATLVSSETAPKVEDVSVSHPKRRVKERATGVSRLRHQPAE